MENKFEIEASANCKDVTSAIRTTASCMAKIDNMMIDYEKDDRRRKALSEAVKHYDEALEALANFVGFETLSNALDNITQ